jgi:hypothetical protein
MKIKNFPLVYVTWLDAESDGDWQSIEDLEDHLPEVHTVGLLIKESKSMITLAQNFDDKNEHVSNIISIPTAWCVNMQSLGIDAIFDLDKN